VSSAQNFGANTSSMKRVPFSALTAVSCAVRRCCN